MAGWLTLMLVIAIAGREAMRELTVFQLMEMRSLIGLVLVFAVLSWVQPGSPVLHVLGRLCEPLLRPLRRFIPLVGGVDLSPLAVVVLLMWWLTWTLLRFLRAAWRRVFRWFDGPFKVT